MKSILPAFFHYWKELSFVGRVFTAVFLISTMLLTAFLINVAVFHRYKTQYEREIQQRQQIIDQQVRIIEQQGLIIQLAIENKTNIQKLTDETQSKQ